MINQKNELRDYRGLVYFTLGKNSGHHIAHSLGFERGSLSDHLRVYNHLEISQPTDNSHLVRWGKALVSKLVSESPNFTISNRHPANSQYYELKKLENIIIGKKDILSKMKELDLKFKSFYIKLIKKY